VPTATLPQLWRGRSGREYVPFEQARVRHGGMATVRKVIGRGGPVGNSVVADGVPLALKLWTESDDASLDQLQAEARILVEISAHPGELPCPRLYDLVGNPLVTGLVMEWCPADLERWWRDKLKEPDSFGRLMATMAEVARRVADYHVFFAQKQGLDAAHGDLKPSNILLSSDGRWLISDFGAARVKPPDDNPLVTSKVVAGTENFLSPEALFHAKRRHHAAMDTWALAATAFTMLRLQRMALDNAPIPKNGTQNPRFRMQRIHDIMEVYAKEPTRFRDRDLLVEAFSDPVRIPEQDRRAVRESLRGAFGAEDPQREEVLGKELLEVLDRALAIEPRYRFTDARDLAAAFERLLRLYLELSAPAARTPTPVLPPPDPAPFVKAREEAVRAQREAEERAQQLQEEMEAMRERLQDAEGRLTAALYQPGLPMSAPAPTPLKARTPPPPPRVEKVVEVVEVPAIPSWWGVLLVVVLLFQLVTLVLVALAAAGSILG
jgi:serine/threonine protein kinase